MKNKMKRKLSGFLAVILCAVSLIFPVKEEVLASSYWRWDTVADEQKVQSGFASSRSNEKKINSKAWKKINGVCYNGSGEPITGAITRGMDVSEWQEKIDWKKVKKSDIDFAFVRISYGIGYMDKTYDYNMKQANLAGVPVGTYVYSLATTTDMALKEAQLAINKMKGYKVSYPVVIDLEYSKMQRLSKKQVARIALAFCNEIKKAGYYPMIYSNTYWYNNHIEMDMLSGIDMWLARYGDTISAPSHSDYRYTIWQSTDGSGGGTMNSTKGLVSGIPVGNNIDMNFGFVDYTKIITPRTKPKSGYKPASSPNINTIAAGSSNTGWKTKNGKTYYYKNGKKLTGWQKIGNKKYYFAPSSGEMYKSRIITQGTNIYYVNKAGEQVSNQWVTYAGKTYYIGSAGRALKGVRNIDGKNYYFNSKKAYMYKNKKAINPNTGAIYYFGSDGARYENGIRRIKENKVVNTYYFHEDGKAHKGWLKLNGKLYYFRKGTSKKSGVRAENVKLVSSSGIISVFDKNGVCTKRYKK